MRAVPEGSTRIKQGRRVIKMGGRWLLNARVVMEKKLGAPIPDGMDVHHRNDQTLDDNPDNLELKPHAKHKAHHNRGNAYNRKFSPDIVKVAAVLREFGWSYQRIAKGLGLDYRTVFNNKSLFAGMAHNLTDSQVIASIMAGSEAILSQHLPHSMALYDKSRRMP